MDLRHVQARMGVLGRAALGEYGVTLCAICQESAARHPDAAQLREPREGVAIIGRTDALLPCPAAVLPDVRIGDVVRVSLVAAAVPDMNFCDDAACENGRWMHL